MTRAFLALTVALVAIRRFLGETRSADLVNHVANRENTRGFRGRLLGGKSSGKSGDSGVGEGIWIGNESASC